MKNILLASVAALAFVGAAEASAFGGAYVGADLGWLYGKAKANPNVNSTFNQGAKSGFAYGFFGGYGKAFNKMYLGLEAAFQGDTAQPKMTVDSSNNYAQAHNNVSFNLTPRFGHIFDNNMISLRMGVKYGKVIVKDQNNNVLGKPAAGFGFIMGPQFERKLTDNVIARIGYEFSALTMKQSSGNPSLGRYVNHRFAIGASYQF